ncbi:MAG: PspC domain-containing protein [Solirubrobacterales bacterium]|nr:PspC domain-containing protein [Solirubrobacterales bacterium]
MTSDTQPPDTPRFLRTKEDRYLAGVGGGLGRAFGVDPLIFRILLGALFLAGGLGFFFYLAAVLFVPSDDGTGQAAPRGRGDTFRRLLVVSAVGLGALTAAAVLFGGAAWATAAGGGLAVAIVVLALGIGLLFGALTGERRLRWLAVPAIVLAFPAAVVSAADISLDGGVGERRYAPVGADPLPAGYRLGVGELVVDLRKLDWSDARRERLDLDMSVGHVLVIVPPEVCVASRTRVRAGAADVLGRTSEGVEIDQELPRSPAPGRPGLALDVDLRVGGFEVRHRDTTSSASSGGESSSRLNRDEAAAADRACAEATR